ncbi:helicase-related protein [Sphingomonas sp.]|uniref:helicase-related protein n=1 Tax=Sphingomonas sp. TaxID=28214 RepID=UPI00356B4FA1
MFDPITSALIASSPPLAGLDLDALPKKLTEAFTDIVAARIRLRGVQGEAASAELATVLAEVRRLAAAHEAFVALLPERENRRAAAFVAASAHQVCLLGEESKGERIASYVDGAGVASEVSATLLFLVAEAHADAAESAKRIRADRDESTPVERALLLAIKLLASGRLRDASRLPAPAIDLELESPELAVEALLLELLKGVRSIAARLMLRVDAAPGVGGIAPATEFFQRVKDLSVGRLDDILVLPEAIVTTPERCLMLMSMQPEAFADLGLIVFDECHLLHPRDAERSRRSVDAMLAVLNLTQLAPAADLLLLSAMMKNAEEIAEWASELTGRQCLALNLAWKPTRQVRGSVVYPAKRITELNGKLKAARDANPNHQNAPVAVKREMKAQPFGFFGLLQTWATKNRGDYTLLPLLPEEHSLSTGRSKGGRWYLTPNGNQTSATLAAAAASSGLKTLVFVQTIPLAEASARDFHRQLDAPTVTLSDSEAELYRLAAEEMGNASHCYLRLRADGAFVGGAASHHSLLLREERQLHEALFKREGGISVLFATSTLAQGMNLPSQVVIISGDSRFDPEVDKMAQLEAHELLNAAGRAGRAGEGSQGFVMVVPSRVVEFDDQSNLINAHWITLQSIFSQSDQCLVIDDPTTALLDKIHEGTVDHGMPAYLVSRLPLPADDGGDAPLRTLLSRSFAAFRARKRGDVEWIESRIASAFAAKKKLEPPEADHWLDRVSGLTGVSVETLREIGAVFDDPQRSVDTTVAVDALVAWLNEKPAKLLELVRPENVQGLFGGAYEKLATDDQRGRYALPVIEPMLKRWMAGEPLKKIEEAYPGGGDREKCEYSRHFVLRLVPDLAFLAGLPARILHARNAKDGIEAPIRSVLTTLSGSVREGCSGAECLAVRKNAGSSVSRVAARGLYDQIAQAIPAGTENEDFEATTDRVRSAWALLAFDDLDES